MDKQIRTGKPAKLFVYLPIYHQTSKDNKVYVRTVIKDLPFSRIEVGDSFIVKKRDSIADLLKNENEFKVEQVKRSMIDGSCIAVLEAITFTKKDEVTDFLKNKRSCI